MIVLDINNDNEGDTFYREHQGMLTIFWHKEQWDRKRQRYEDNSYVNRRITSEDDPDGGIDALEIERIARPRILLED